MGAMNAEGMSQAAAEGLISLRQALSWHLTSNHYPPLPGAWVSSAVEAIEAVNEGNWEHVVTLPEAGVFAEQTYSAGEIIERMHLESFLDDDEVDEEWFLFGDDDDDDEA